MSYLATSHYYCNVPAPACAHHFVLSMREKSKLWTWKKETETWKTPPAWQGFAYPFRKFLSDVTANLSSANPQQQRLRHRDGVLGHCQSEGEKGFSNPGISRSRTNGKCWHRGWADWSQVTAVSVPLLPKKPKARPGLSRITNERSFLR